MFEQPSLRRPRLSKAIENLQNFSLDADPSFRHFQLDVSRELKLLTELNFIQGEERWGRKGAFKDLITSSAVFKNHVRFKANAGTILKRDFGSCAGCRNVSVAALPHPCCQDYSKHFYVFLS